MCAQRWPAAHTQLTRKSRLVWLACAVDNVLAYRPTALLSSTASGPGTGRRWGVGGEAGCLACAVDARGFARRDEELSSAGVNPAFNSAFRSRRCRPFPGENAGRALGGEQIGSTLHRSRARLSCAPWFGRTDGAQRDRGHLCVTSGQAKSLQFKSYPVQRRRCGQASLRWAYSPPSRKLNEIQPFAGKIREGLGFWEDCAAH